MGRVISGEDWVIVNKWCGESVAESLQTVKHTRNQLLLHLLSMQTASYFCTRACGEAQNQPTFKQHFHADETVESGSKWRYKTVCESRHEHESADV